MPKQIAQAEYTVSLATGNVRYDDFHTAWMIACRNGGQLTGRSKLRPLNNDARRALAKKWGY